jgi:hypothetical protein
MENVKELRELLTLLFALQGAMVGALKDGKFSRFDLLQFWGIVPLIKPAFEKLGNPIERYKALTLDERAELVEELKVGFDLPNDEVETLIEDSLTLAVANIELYKRWASLGKVAA